MPKTYAEYYEETKKQTNEQREKDIKTIEDGAKTSIESATNSYNLAVDSAKKDYESLYEKNAVQKIINEHMIAQKNAELGLTDSGLNRTQQTASQLSYANQKGNISLQRQNALDTLNNNLADAITKINLEAESNKMSVNQMYATQNAEIANSLYNTDSQSETAINTAEIQANSARETMEKQVELEKWLKNQDTATSLKIAELQNENNMRIAEYQRETELKNAEISKLQTQLAANSELEKAKIEKEYKQKIAELENSTALKIAEIQANYGKEAAEKAKTTEKEKTTKKATTTSNSNMFYELKKTTENSSKIYGTFSNGYQPKGIVNHGKLTKTSDKIKIACGTQSIWRAEDGTLWYWDDFAKGYFSFSKNKK